MEGVYLFPGMIFADRGEFAVSTVLGSCVAVCLWDPATGTGGINHYLLPLWNGEGLASPRFGNVAIRNLLGRMLELGCARRSLRAKVFGGGAVLKGANGLWNVGERNVMVAEDVLSEEGIPIVSRDTGGTDSRRLRFITATGDVYLKRIPGLAGD